jgi:hypothetical protein
MFGTLSLNVVPRNTQENRTMRLPDHIRILGLLMVLGISHDSFAQTKRLERLTILENNYPKFFYFRGSENVSGPLSDYDRWEREFGRAMGIEGKVLDEEVYVDPTEKIRRFDRFKRAHPDQLALVHFNGSCRDPRYEIGDFSAGHWLYYNGAKILDDVPAETGITRIRVSDASLFGVGIGRGGKRVNEDIGFCRLDENGHPDWSRAEQVRLLSVNLDDQTIEVQRGAYGTRPLAWTSGNAHAAAHCSDGPWGTRDNKVLMWYYNFATCCPRDDQGRDCADVQSRFLQSLFDNRGPLAALDGIEFDVLWGDPYIPGWCLYNESKRGPDCNADGQRDDGVIDGVHVYQAGVYQYIQKLRQRLGPDRLILADGTRFVQQRAFGLLNGIETEAFPNNDDAEIHDWSGAINKLLFWRQHSAEPSLQYTAHKFRLKRKSDDHPMAVPFSTHRLILAANALTDTATALNSSPGPDAGGLPSIWDELVKGTEHQFGWLGRPLQPVQRLALSTPDLIQGHGSPPSKVLISHMTSPDAVATSQSDTLVVRAKDPAADHFQFTLHNVPCDGPELFVAMRLRSAPRAGHPHNLGRLVRFGITGRRSLLSADLPTTGIRLRDGIPQSPVAFGASVEFETELDLDGKPVPGCRVHPPYRDANPGAVYWEDEAIVPEDARLFFRTAVSPESKKRGDGVLLSIEVAPADATDKDFTTIWSQLRREDQWVPVNVPLTPYAGKRMRFRFVTDCGKADNTTVDHTYWSSVWMLVGDEAPEAQTHPVRFETWTLPESFDAGFYFRKIRSPRVDLTWTVESSEPVMIEKLSVHAASDTMARRFENGLVLANPSYQPRTFDLTAVAPGTRFRRLAGSPNQDLQINSGKEVGSSVMLQPLDGLFLQTID